MLSRSPLLKVRFVASKIMFLFIAVDFDVVFDVVAVVAFVVVVVVVSSCCCTL